MNLKSDNLKNKLADKIELDSRNIATIDPKTFEGCQNLTNLNLYGNKLKFINSETFKHPINLRVLWLFDNQIYSICSSFYYCTNLVELYLSSNQITNIEKYTFSNCINLEKLWLNNNKIVSINTKGFQGCNKLLELELSNNNIKKIHPETFENCPKLQHLYLQGNQLNSIVFFSVNELKTVTLADKYTVKLAETEFNNGIEVKVKDNVSSIKVWTDYKMKEMSDNITDLNEEIVQYFIEYCFKKQLLMSLMHEFIRKHMLVNLKYVLKINSIFKLFEIDKLTNANGQTLLHIACFFGSYESVQLLCSFKASTAVVDMFGKTPIQEAILAIDSLNKNKILETLIENGADYRKAFECEETNNKMKIVQLNLKQIVEKREIYAKDISKIRNLVFQGLKK